MGSLRLLRRARIASPCYKPFASGKPCSEYPAARSPWDGLMGCGATGCICSADAFPHPSLRQKNDKDFVAACACCAAVACGQVGCAEMGAGAFHCSVFSSRHEHGRFRRAHVWRGIRRHREVAVSPRRPWRTCTWRDCVGFARHLVAVGRGVVDGACRARCRNSGCCARAAQIAAPRPAVSLRARPGSAARVCAVTRPNLPMRRGAPSSFKRPFESPDAGCRRWVVPPFPLNTRRANGALALEMGAAAGAVRAAWPRSCSRQWGLRAFRQGKWSTADSALRGMAPAKNPSTVALPRQHGHGAQAAVRCRHTDCAPAWCRLSSTVCVCVPGGQASAGA